MVVHVRTFIVFVMIVLYTAGGLPSLVRGEVGSAPAPASKKGSFFDAAVESLTGDVYDHSKWRELSLGTLFSEGWDEAWVSPQTGGGGAPRQGWLNAYDGVFYRLGIATYSYANDFAKNGNQNAGLLQFYLPFNRRFEIRTDIPMVVSNRGVTGTNSQSNFGDLVITPRLILSETRNVTQ